MKTTLRKISLPLFLFSASLAARAATPLVHFDVWGMPRCLQGQAPGEPAVLLDWDSGDLYQRDVRAYMFPAGACGQWARSLSQARRTQGSLVVDGITNVGGYDLPPMVIEALRQVRHGGTRFRPEGNAAAFLSAHSIPDFNVELNRHLTSLYGVGFVSELYKAWIESQPANAYFRSLVLARSAETYSRRGPFMASRLANRVFVLVKGLGHEAPAAERFAPLKQDLEAMGAQFVVVPTSGFGDIAKNAELIQGVLSQVLASGRNAILISLSKGSAEAALAVAGMHDRLDHPAPGEGRLEAFVGMSPVYRPSFVIDHVTRFPHWLIARPLLMAGFRREGLDIHSVVGLKQLGSAFLDSVLPQYQYSLPRTPIYINILGVEEGYGLTSSVKHIRMLQDQLIRKRIRKGFGANDGYVEYPGNEIRTSWAPRVYTLAVNACHDITGGHVGRFELSDANQRWAAIGGMFGAILDLCDHR